MRVNALSSDKNSFFDQLQLRQAEIESSQFYLETLQSQNAELHHQLREASDRLGLLNEELVEARREQDSTLRGTTTSAEDLARLLSAAERKHEGKIADLKRNLVAVEKERNEGEAAWSRKLQEKTNETEGLKRVLESSAKIRDQNDEVVGSLRDKVESLQQECRSYHNQISELHARLENVTNAEVLFVIYQNIDVTNHS
jgi:chromosome segregation ATPase